MHRRVRGDLQRQGLGRESHIVHRQDRHRPRNAGPVDDPREALAAQRVGRGREVRNAAPRRRRRAPPRRQRGGRESPVQTVGGRPRLACRRMWRNVRRRRRRVHGTRHPRMPPGAAAFVLPPLPRSLALAFSGRLPRLDVHGPEHAHRSLFAGRRDASKRCNPSRQGQHVPRVRSGETAHRTPLPGTTLHQSRDRQIRKPSVERGTRASGIPDPRFLRRHSESSWHASGPRPPLGYVPSKAGLRRRVTCLSARRHRLQGALNRPDTPTPACVVQTPPSRR